MKTCKISLRELVTIQSGYSPSTFQLKVTGNFPYVKVEDMNNCQKCQFESREYTDDFNHIVPKGSIIFPKRGAAIMNNKVRIAARDLCMDTNMMAIIPNEKVLSEYLFYVIIHEQLYKIADTSTIPQINNKHIYPYKIPLPSIAAQEKFVELISTWDAAIEKTERLIAAKEKRYSWLSGGYLFGSNCHNANTKKRTRWFSVPGHWKIVKVGSIAKEIKAINISGESIPVLSCTKYDGLVDSLTYFDKQVFSMDTSTYKVVSKSQFVYATNHIEEGSIGYQDLYDKGLVSPMYTVFETDESIHDGYLYKILKTAIYRHIFQVNTSASVDRRGSLRWNEFAKIPIPLPPMDNQRKISAFLDTARHEISLLKRQADAYCKQKRGLMQELLT